MDHDGHSAREAGAADNVGVKRAAPALSPLAMNGGVLEAQGVKKRRLPSGSLNAEEPRFPQRQVQSPNYAALNRGYSGYSPRAAPKADTTVPAAVWSLRQQVIEHKMVQANQLQLQRNIALTELEFLQKGGLYIDHDAPQFPVATTTTEPSGGGGIGQQRSLGTLAFLNRGPKSSAELEARRNELALKIKEFQNNAGRKMRIGNEPPRNKAHWDYLLGEMEWMAKDFVRELKWKQASTKKLNRALDQFHQRLKTQDHRLRKKEETERKKRAAEVSKCIKIFWWNIRYLARRKYNEHLERKKKAALDRHLEFLVNETERYTTQLAKKLVNVQPSPTGSAAGSVGAGSDAGGDEDEEFVLDEEEEEEEDDEETLEKQEADEAKEAKKLGKDPVDEELNDLEKQKDMPLEELLKQYASQQGDGDDVEESDSEEEEDDSADESADQGGTANDIEMVDGKVGEDVGVGTEALLADDQPSQEQERITAAVQKAEAAMPTGTTYATVTVQTTLPHLLRGTLREYQHIGLDWLVSMYDNGLNGILADEMGLGKTIQTIALLGYLAVEKHIWGQHLVVVPTSVMLNWEMEFKRWLPGFKVVTYYGTAKQRKAKRKGWSNPNAFHVCITSYQLILQDKHVFSRKKWHYMILDEAQNIKNFASQRWQVMISFSTERRLLLTGTPLQNNMMELWSLMHFLMPQVFQSQKEFKEWFSKPVDSMIQGKEEMNEKIIQRLHGVLRPFLLRRMKTDVLKQLPDKVEHVVSCRLSKRQRQLYEDFMHASDTQQQLASGNYMKLMNVLMQLRKVCNHPDIFAGRPIISPFDQLDPVEYHTASAVVSLTSAVDPLSVVSKHFVHSLVQAHASMSSWGSRAVKELQTPTSVFTNAVESSRDAFLPPGVELTPGDVYYGQFWANYTKTIQQARADNMRRASCVNEIRCASMNVLYPWDLCELLHVEDPVSDIHVISRDPRRGPQSDALQSMVQLPEDRLENMRDALERFVCIIPRARAPEVQLHCSHPDPSAVNQERTRQARLQVALSPMTSVFRLPFVRTQMYFPDKRLIQFDCGKLQALAVLFRRLKAEGHRVLLFSQMTRMLDILESFLNLYGYKYLRLDGATKVDERQRLMERYNNDDRIFCFILSTRSGGLGINLTGADTVVFYDTDWNPAIDQQAQDRCHRIGQTRQVHIYRLVTKDSVEENILRKSNQKKRMNAVVIGDGQFTTDFFETIDPRELLGIESADDEEPTVSQEGGLSGLASTPAAASATTESAAANPKQAKPNAAEIELAMTQAEDAQDRLAAKMLMDEVRGDALEFESAPKPQFQPLPPLEVEKHLNRVEKYALHFAEEIDPVVTAHERLAHEQSLKFQEEKWQSEQLKKRKEQEESLKMMKSGGTVTAQGHGAVDESTEDPSERSKRPKGRAEEEFIFYPLADVTPRPEQADQVQQDNQSTKRDRYDMPSDPNVEGIDTAPKVASASVLAHLKELGEKGGMLYDTSLDGPPYVSLEAERLHPGSASYVHNAEVKFPGDDADWWGLFATPEDLGKMLGRKIKKPSDIKLAVSRRTHRRSYGQDPLIIRIPKRKIKGYKKMASVPRRSTGPQPRSIRDIRSSPAALSWNSASLPPPWVDTNKDFKDHKRKLNKMRRAQRGVADEGEVVNSLKAALEWSKDEDKMLLDIVKRYGPNWNLASEILKSEPTVSGRWRSVAACKRRWRVMNGLVTDASEDTTPRHRKRKKTSRSGNKKESDAPPPKRIPHGFGSQPMHQHMTECMKIVTNQKKACKEALRTSLPPSTDAAKIVTQRVHASHKHAVTDAHGRLGLPPQAIGKTLMPHQVISLRMRRLHSQKGGVRPQYPAGAQGQGRLVNVQQFSDMHGSQPRVSTSHLGVGRPNVKNSKTKTPKKGKKTGEKGTKTGKKTTKSSKKGKNPGMGPQGNSFAHQNPAAAAGASGSYGRPAGVPFGGAPSNQVYGNSGQQYGTHAYAGAAAGTGAAAAAAPGLGTAQQQQPTQNPDAWLQNILHQAPHLRSAVQSVLNKGDWSQQQKLDYINRIWKEEQAKARGGAR